MLKLLFGLAGLLVSRLKQRHELALENVALRQQLPVVHRTQPHPRMRKLDRLYWVWLSRIWDKWKQPLLIVRPDTVVRGHRQGGRPLLETDFQEEELSFAKMITDGK